MAQPVQPPDPAPRPRRRLPRWVRWPLFLLALLVVLPVLVAGVFLAQFDPNTQKPRIIAAVEGATARQLTLNGPIGLKLALVPTLTLEDVGFANMPGGSRPEMAHIRRAEVQLALLPLLSGRIEFGQITLAGPDILLETDTAGRPNWLFGAAQPAPPGAPTPATPPRPDAPPNIALAGLTITDARLAYRDGKTGTTQVLGVARAALTTESGGMALDGAFAFNDLPFTLKGRLGSLALLFDPGDVAARTPWPVRLELTSTPLRLLLEGTVAQPLAARGWDVALTGHVPDLPQLLALLPSGLLPPQLAALPPLRDLDLALRVADSGGPLPRLGQLQLSLGATDLAGLRPGLLLTRLVLRQPDAAAPVTVDLAATASGLPLQLTGTVGPPARLLAAPTGSPTPWPVDLALAAGPATATLKGAIADPAAATGVDLAVQLRVPELAALAPLLGPRLPPLRDLALDLRLSERGPRFAQGIHLAGLRGTSSAGDLAGELDLDWAPRPRLAGTLSANRLDADALRRPPAATDPAVSAPAPRDGRLIPNLALPLDALRGFDAALQLQVAELIAGGTPLRTVSATLTAAEGRARIDPGSATLPGGPVTFRLAADTTTQPPTVQLALHGEGLELAPLLAALHASTGSAGRLELDLDLRGQGTDLREVAASSFGHLGFALTAGSVQMAGGGPLGRILGDVARLVPRAPSGGRIAVACAAGRFEMEAGIAQLRTLLLDTSLGRIAGSGRASLRDETLAILLQTDLRLPVPGGTLLRLRAPVPLGGTFAAPRAEFGAIAPNALLGEAGNLLRAPSNLADGVLGALGGAAGSVPGAGGGLPDCGAALAAVRGGRAGPVPPSAVPTDPPPSANPERERPAAERSERPAAERSERPADVARDLLRGLLRR